MVDQEIFLRRLEALRGYLNAVKSFRQVARDEFTRVPAIHDLHDYLRIDHGIVWEAIQHDLATIDTFYAWTASKLEL